MGRAAAKQERPVQPDRNAINSYALFAGRSLLCMQTHSKDFWKLFRPSACSLKLTGADKGAVFDELLEVLEKAKLLPGDLRAAARSALLEREELASTGVGQNVAIPHVVLKGLDQAVFGLGLHPQGVEWNAVDGDVVKLFFVVLRPAKASPQYDPDRHREMMAWIAGLAREPDFRRFALQVQNRTELVDLVKEMSAKLS